MNAIQYRTFRNADPPQLVSLWEACQLGRGAVVGLTCDALDLTVMSRPYFDRHGMIVALDHDRIVGMAHAGFGMQPEASVVDTTQGVICALLVHPLYRRQGLGTELLRRAEAYLVDRGAVSIHAGGGPGRDPFYCGIYGGSEPAGFLITDELIGPFLQKHGYEAVERHFVFQRRLSESRDPFGLRVMSVKRSTKLVALHNESERSWWWNCRFGAIDSIELGLTGKTTTEPMARVTALALDQYSAKWGDHRPVGLSEVFVPESLRRKGYAQVLLLETARKMKGELAGLIEMHVPEANTAGLALAKSAVFKHVDTGVVYRRSSQP